MEFLKKLFGRRTSRCAFCRAVLLSSRDVLVSGKTMQAGYRCPQCSAVTCLRCATNAGLAPHNVQMSLSGTVVSNTGKPISLQQGMEVLQKQGGQLRPECPKCHRDLSREQPFDFIEV